MIFIDLNNRSKNFTDKVIDIVKDTNEKVIINSSKECITPSNVTIKNISSNSALVRIAKNARVVIIFSTHDYKKYIGYCNRTVLITDYCNENNIDNNNLEFVNIRNMYRILNDDDFDTKKKNKLPIIFLIILLVIFILLFVIELNNNSSLTKINNKYKNKISSLNKINNNYTNYLFLGDSITDYYDLDKYYDGEKVVNSGISGDITNDILDNMKSRVYVYNPSVVFLLIGTNDLERDRSVEDTTNNIEEIVKKINDNLPNAKVYVESIYPINNTDDDKINKTMVGKRENSDIKEINNNLKDYCNSTNCIYLDIYSLLKDEDDNLKLEYTTEGLHISDEGYEVITNELKKYMVK